jgi:uncharacterized membrane protein YdbT with pleckstrin-like domain
MLRLTNLPGQLPDEKILGMYRRHPITVLGLLAAFAVLILLPFGAYAYIKIVDSPVLSSPDSGLLVILGGGIFLLFALLFIYQSFLDYWLDSWIVTNFRIINIEQHGLFSRTVSELRLYRVQDVTADVTGFMHSMLDFGQVYIQTAGEQERFIFQDVPHPNKIAKDVMNLAEQDRKEHLDEAMEAIEETHEGKHDEIKEKAQRRLEP